MKTKNDKTPEMRAPIRNYKMITAEDGITWITIQPLLEQVMMHREESHKIPTDNLTDDEKRGVDFAVLNIEAVANFLRSLLVEHDLEKIVDKGAIGDA
tara:strand:+ start:263 stop:556 length:294 start_codon:yes stop_codon:yes gene_type:complete